MTQDILKKAYELGYKFEREYHGCAQCVIGAFYQLFPIARNEDIFRSGNAQAGGLGLSAKGQCGAVAGAAMIISQFYGRSLGGIADPERKRFVAYQKGAEFGEKFAAEFGTLICGDIQKKMMGRSFNLLKPEDWEQFENAGGHDTHCPQVVGTATRILVEMLLADPDLKLQG